MVEQELTERKKRKIMQRYLHRYTHWLEGFQFFFVLSFLNISSTCKDPQSYDPSLTSYENSNFVRVLKVSQE